MKRKRIVHRDRERIEKPRQRWPYVVGGLLLLMVVGVGFAPNIIAATGLANGFIGSALGDLNGKATASRISLAWFSPIAAEGIKVVDADGNAVLAVERVESSKTLLSLAWSRSSLGTFTFIRPAVILVCEETTSNLERVLANYLRAQPSTSARPDVTIRIVDGVASIDDKFADREWSIGEINASVVVPSNSNEAIVAEIKAKEGANGSIDAQFVLGSETTGKLVLSEVAAGIAEPWIRRVEPGLRADASINADIVFDGKNLATKPTMEASGQVSATAIRFAAPTLGPKPIALNSVSFPFAASGSADSIAVTSASLSCDFGSARFTGTLPLDRPVPRWIEQSGISVSADVDLAKLAAIAPELVRLKPGTSISKGGVTLTLASKSANETDVRWVGNITSKTLAGVADGKSLEWNEPLSADFAYRHRPHKPPAIDQLRVTSDVITASLSGTQEELSLTAEASLDRLSARLSQFVELGGWQLAGTAHLSAKSTLGIDGRISIVGNASANQLAFGIGKRAINEPSAKIAFDTRTTPNRLGLEAGNLQISAGGDTCSIQMVEPIPEFASLSTGKGKAVITGDFSRWRNRLQPFVGIPREWTIAGNGSIALTAAFEGNSKAKVDLAGDVTDVRFVGAGVELIEPRVIIRGMTEVPALTVDTGSGSIAAKAFLLQSATASVVVDHATFTPLNGGKFTIVGTARTNANMGRLHRMFKLQTDPAGSDAVAGTITNGIVNIEAKDDTYQFSATLPLKQVVYGSPSKPTWSEPFVTTVVRGEYRPASDEVALHQLSVARTQGFAIQAKGSIKQVSHVRDVDISGTINYDLKEMEPQLRQLLGASVRAEGKGPGTFQITGPLGGDANRVATPLRNVSTNRSEPGIYSKLNGNAQMSWQLLHAYGFDVGASRLNARMQQGVVAIDPISATFGGTGKIKVQPTINLDTPQWDLTLARDKIIENAQVTPAACADALGFALPALAKANQAEGLISFEILENRIPLMDPTRGVVKGKLTLHRVTVTASPLMAELAKLLGANQTTFRLADGQVVPVRMENGRVYHENMDLTFGKTVIRTSGSVGLDQLLNMLAEVPIPANALGSLARNQPSLAEQLSSRRIRVPIAGSLAHPRLDARAFQTEIRKAAEDIAAKSVGKRIDAEVEKGKKKVGEKLEEGLKKLFRSNEN